MRRFALVLLVAAGCHDDQAVPPPLTPANDMAMGSGPGGTGPSPEPGGPVDMAVPADDLATAPADLAMATPDMATTPPGPANATLTGLNVLDVSVDQGGGVWAVTAATVYYLPSGRSTPFTYDQSSGLARGWHTWTDTWFNPGTWPVTFSSVSGATSGQAMVGNIGAIADRLEVNPSNGAVLRIDNLAVTSAQQPNPTELAAQQARVVAVWRSVVDLNGTYSGTSYLGGFHGTYAFHGLTGNCGCTPAFEEHMHVITDSDVYGGDTRGLAISPMGDLWTGDRDVLACLPQRSMGPYTDFFMTYSAVIDVWPGVRDEIAGIATDSGNGVWVASNTNGLAHVSSSQSVAFISTPQAALRGVAVDNKGMVWVGTATMGLGRYDPAARSWTWYHASSGLPSDNVQAVYFDRWSGGAKIWVATDYGIAAIQP
jgi:hypothetical protein